MKQKFTGLLACIMFLAGSTLITDQANSVSDQTVEPEEYLAGHPGKMSYNRVIRYKIANNFALPMDPDDPLDGIESDPMYHGNTAAQRTFNSNELTLVRNQSTATPKAAAWFDTEFINTNQTEGRTGWIYSVYWPLNAQGRPFNPGGVSPLVAAPCPPFCQGDSGITVNPPEPGDN